VTLSVIAWPPRRVSRFAPTMARTEWWLGQAQIGLKDAADLTVLLGANLPVSLIVAGTSPVTMFASTGSGWSIQPSWT